LKLVTVALIQLSDIERFPAELGLARLEVWTKSKMSLIISLQAQGMFD